MSTKSERRAAREAAAAYHEAQLAALLQRVGEAADSFKTRGDSLLRVALKPLSLGGVTTCAS
jgi:hypothetical protein